MFHRQPDTWAAGHRGQASAAPGHELVDSPVPARACCCLAKPMVKVIMPPTPGRPHPVDLWLCGHHYHASRQALAAAGARVRDPRLPPAEAGLALTTTVAP